MATPRYVNGLVRDPDIKFITLRDLPRLPSMQPPSWISSGTMIAWVGPGFVESGRFSIRGGQSGILKATGQSHFQQNSQQLRASPLNPIFCRRTNIVIVVHGGFAQVQHLAVDPFDFHPVHPFGLPQTKTHGVRVLRTIGIARYDFPDCAPPGVMQRHPRAYGRWFSAFLPKTETDPVATVVERVLVDSQRLLHFRPGLERRYQQIRATVAVQIIGHNVARGFFHRDPRQVPDLYKGGAALIPIEPVFFVTAVRLSLPAGIPDLLSEVGVLDDAFP